MSRIEYIPKYIRQVLNDVPRKTVTAARWNELLNLLITQGDYNSETLAALALYNIVRTTVDSSFNYIRLTADNDLEVSTDGITWQATRSSGHTVLDSAGNILPQRSRIKFIGAEVTDNGTETVITPTGEGAVPVTRTVNGKALSENISLTPSDVGAAPVSHTHTASTITDFASAVATVMTGTAKIMAGSYTGTGAYGVDNKCSLDGGFTVDFAILIGPYTCRWIRGMAGTIQEYNPSGSGGIVGGTVSISGTAFQWYNTESAFKQLNASGTTYYYMLIGH